MRAQRRFLLLKLALLAAMVSSLVTLQSARCQSAPGPSAVRLSPVQSVTGVVPTSGDPQPAAAPTSGPPLPATGTRCTVQAQNGAWLCLQGLRDAGTTLRAYLTYFQDKAGLQLVKNPTLALDGVPQRIINVSTFEKSGEQLSVQMVVKFVGTVADAEIHPSLRMGVDTVIKKAGKLPGSRIGLIGYNVRRANYQPNVELGDDAGLQNAAGLVTPIGGGLSFELFDALNEAINRLEREPAAQRRVLLVFTDGLEKDRDRDRLFQQLAQRAVRADVLVQTIMMPNREPKPYIRVLADSTGGLTQVPQDGDGVTRAFEHVANDLLNQSVVTYDLVRPATARPGIRQRHSITLAYQGLSLSATEDILWANPSATQKPAMGMAQQADSAPMDLSFLSTLLRVLIPVAVIVGLGLLVLSLVSKRFRKGPKSEGTGNVFLLDGSTLKGSAGARVPVASMPLFPLARPGSKGRPAPLVVFWLYEVDRQRTHAVTRFPFTIGNDLDCDLVLRGVGSDVASCQICFDRKQASLRKWQGAPPLMNGKQLDGAMPVQERAEFTVAGQRLVLFETSIS